MPSASANPLGLGKAITEFQGSAQSVVKVLVVSLICLLIAALIFSGAFAKNAGLDQRIVLSILGLIFLLPPGFGIYMLITRRGSSVTLHENGLVYRMGGKEFVTTWEDIASLTESTASRVEKKDGQTFNLGQNVSGYDEIALKLREETLNRMLPKAKESIARGSALVFRGLKAEGKVPLGKGLPDVLLGGGAFIVDAQGIQLEKDGTRIAWSEVRDFGIRQGEARRARFAFFFIEGQELSFEMNYGALPNAHLLTALCAELTPHLHRESD